MSNENLTGIQGDTRKRLSVSFQLDDKDSKTDVHETTQDMNRILNLSNENISSTLGKFLNPDAPDFKPSDSRLSLHSLPAQGHKQRRATHSEVYDKHHSRQRNFSDTYANMIHRPFHRCYLSYHNTFQNIEDHGLQQCQQQQHHHHNHQHQIRHGGHKNIVIHQV